MTITHFTDTDSLYLEFSRRPRGEIREIAKDTRGEFDSSGQLIAITIEHASEHCDLSKIELKGFPFNVP
jgi:uncharacterized protein YuzE